MLTKKNIATKLKDNKNNKIKITTTMFEEIRRKREEIRNNILKSFNSDLMKGFDDEFEKAHKDGDMHPNGKWVWVSSAAGGKGDWRKINGRAHQKHQTSQGGGSSSGSATQQQSSGNNVKIRTDLPKIEYGGDAKKDAAASAKAGDILKKEGFTIGDDNLYHHKDGRVLRINAKTGNFEETAGKVPNNSVWGK